MLSGNFNAYSHYVFNTLDQDDTGIITFEVRILDVIHVLLYFSTIYHRMLSANDFKISLIMN